MKESKESQKETSQENVWDLAAQEWNKYRREPLVEVEEFLKGKWGKILDIGCGSGRHFPCIEGEIYGVDFSSKMIEIAQKKSNQMGLKVHLERCEADSLSFNENYFDGVICIATLHCLETKEKRKKALEEIFRVLKSGASALITVWSSTQKRIHGRTGDVYIPWTVNEEKLQRYYYIYSLKELNSLLIEVGFKIIYSEEKENILFEVVKP